MASGDMNIDTAASETTDEKNTSNGTGTPAEETPSKKAKVETADKKGRNGRKNRRSDTDMIEEAKAAYGELNTSEGRQLRKRAEPPKVEKVEKKATPAPARKRKSAANAKKEEKEEKDSSADGESKTADKVDDKDDEKKTVNNEEKPVETTSNGDTAAVPAEPEKVEEPQEKKAEDESEKPEEKKTEAEKE